MADSHAEQTCFKCQKSLSAVDVFSFSGNPWCESCYFEAGEQGPLTEQYRKCPKCGQTVHTFTIRCQNCQTPVHETGTIRIQKPVRSSFIMAYGIIALILVVMAFTIPSFSDKGFISWIVAVLGLGITLHGLLGLSFQFLPFGFKTLRQMHAFMVGFLEAGAGLFLLLWPIL
ncbi:hypothetical protein KKD52_15715 [Myxococcota bacterium]|nr:hypothetical protein [Myxococcota bacterium]